MDKLFYPMMAVKSLIPLDLRLFDNTNVTTDGGLSGEMKTFYAKRLLDNAEPYLVHNRFGQKQTIPAGGGKTIEFRKYTPYPKALVPLEEGVTPHGRKLEMNVITATVDQYGDYTELSDVLKTTAIDPNLLIAIRQHGAQAGRTLDTVTRDVLVGGDNVMYAPAVASNGTETAILLRKDITTACKLTPKMVRLAAGVLKRQLAPYIDGSYIAIIHPDVATDLMGDNDWIEAHKYAKPENIENGEIGKMYNVRFYQSTEAKIIGPKDMLGIPGYKRTKLKTAITTATKDIYPVDAFTTAQATAINAAITAGETYTLYLNGTEVEVDSVTGGASGTCKITLTANVQSIAADAPICGVGAGKLGAAVYCTLFLGNDAYGVTEIEGLGLQHIVKQLGSAGTADPLDQRATAGWKATAVCKRLVEQYMVRVEHSTESFGAEAVSN